MPGVEHPGGEGGGGGGPTAHLDQTGCGPGLLAGLHHRGNDEAQAVSVLLEAGGGLRLRRRGAGCALLLLPCHTRKPVLRHIWK